MIVSQVRNTVSQIAKVTKTNRKEGIQVARRVAKMKDTNVFAGKMLECKSVLSHILAPFFTWASGESKTVKTILDTSRKITKNINKQVGQATTKNPKASKIIAKIKGIDNSLPILGSAALAVTGVKDVNEARKNEGTAAGIKEAGKSVVRVATSTAMATAGALLLPVPGMATAGWLAGEKLANLAVGKPYTEQNRD